MFVRFSTGIFVLLSIALQAQVQSLQPDEFEAQLKTEQPAQLLDLRDDDDFANGHIKKAVNYDYNDEGFESFVLRNFNRKKPLFIYCFSGVRSNEAKMYLKELGFTRVFELEKGFANWTASSKPYVASKAFTKPIAAFTMQDLEREIKTHKMLLVDFYADWCGPCKEMKPTLLKIARENPNIKLLQIDSEKSEDIVALFKVYEIPTLILFKNGQQYWRDSGIKTERQLKKVIQ